MQDVVYAGNNDDNVEIRLDTERVMMRKSPLPSFYVDGKLPLKRRVVGCQSCAGVLARRRCSPARTRFSVRDFSGRVVGAVTDWGGDT